MSYSLIKKCNPHFPFLLNQISHSGLPGNEQHNLTNRQRVERWGGGGGIVVDAALTSVISAEIETRCRDDEKWEARGRGV